MCMSLHMRPEGREYVIAAEQRFLKTFEAETIWINMADVFMDKYGSCVCVDEIQLKNITLFNPTGNCCQCCM